MRRNVIGGGLTLVLLTRLDEKWRPVEMRVEAPTVLEKLAPGPGETRETMTDNHPSQAIDKDPQHVRELVPGIQGEVADLELVANDSTTAAPDRDDLEFDAILPIKPRQTVVGLETKMPLQCVAVATSRSLSGKGKSGRPKCKTQRSLRKRL